MSRKGLEDKDHIGQGSGIKNYRGPQYDPVSMLFFQFSVSRSLQLVGFRCQGGEIQEGSLNAKCILYPFFISVPYGLLEPLSMCGRKKIMATQ